MNALQRPSVSPRASASPTHSRGDTARDAAAARRAALAEKYNKKPSAAAPKQQPYDNEAAPRPPYSGRQDESQNPYPDTNHSQRSRSIRSRTGAQSGSATHLRSDRGESPRVSMQSSDRGTESREHSRRRGAGTSVDTSSVVTSESRSRRTAAQGVGDG